MAQITESLPHTDGIRSAHYRYFTFWTADGEIEICISESGETMQVQGQVLRKEALLPAFAVRLISDQTDVRATETNYIGEFCFNDVPKRPFAIEFLMPGKTLAFGIGGWIDPKRNVFKSNGGV